MSVFNEGLDLLEVYANRIEDDRREPDKILCHVRSMRSAALAAREDTERPEDSCPCGEPSPKGAAPCTFEKPCPYGTGFPRNRWSVEQPDDATLRHAGQEALIALTALKFGDEPSRHAPEVWQCILDAHDLLISALADCTVRDIER